MYDYSIHAWLIVAIVLVTVEIATGTFYLLMLSLAALIAWIATLLGAPFLTQAIIFLMTAIVLSYWVHRYRRKRQLLNTNNTVNNLDAGELVTVTNWHNGIGSTQYRGSNWQVVLNDKNTPAVDGVYQIMRFDGNRLLVQAIDA